jgi:transposase InsO family protein
MAEVVVAPIAGIRPPAPICMDDNLVENWRSFKQKWKNYTIITNLDKQSQQYQVALLLHVMGDQALKTYNGFKFSTGEDERTVDEILKLFDDFAVGEINETYERYMFNKRNQNDGETFEGFLASLRLLIKSCNFCDNCIDSVLRDRIVLGIREDNTQQLLLRERTLTLEKAIDICRAGELALTQGKAYRHDTIHLVEGAHSNRRHPPPQTVSANAKDPQLCKFCGQKHVLVKSLCPAWGKTCNKCLLRNHFAQSCPNSRPTVPSQRRKPVYQVNEAYPEVPEEWVNSIEKVSVSSRPNKDIKCEMMINDEPVVFQIDTGASVNIMPSRYAPYVTPTNKMLTMWNGTRFTPLGSCRTILKNPKNKRRYNVEFLVVKENLTPLLGLSASEQMKLITVNNCNLHRVLNITEKQVTEKYGNVFDGTLGTLEGPVHLHVDKSVHPVVMPARRLPLAVQPKLKVELERLTTLGVITPVDEPTPWVSQIVVTQKKNGDLRVCIDPRELNHALKREHFILPILEDTLHELGQSRFFSKADLSSGFWHVELDHESSFLTTFQTCYGRYRWLRLPFGTSVSSEIFGKKLREALDNLPGVVCIADDVVIHGRTEDQHDRHLDQFLARCQERGIRLNKDKFELKLGEIVFMGHKISAAGLQADPEKVRAITEMRPPENTEELRRFLGIVNYLGKFLSHLSSLTEPLRNLTKQDTPWNWSVSQEVAFNKIKHLVTETPVLAFYDPAKELTLENDACEYGLGSALMQQGRPIAYASRSLSETETRYAQIEKEMLAIVFGLEKFNHFTFGRPVSVITDHKPLTAIVSKPLSKAPKRLQSLLLRTQKYDFSLEYRPGSSIPIADALSRAPLGTQPEQDIETVSNLTFSAINDSRLSEIRDATEQDESLRMLRDVVVKGWPQNKATLPQAVAVYYSYRDELSVQDGIILRGERVVIPRSMREDMKKRLHAGHLGINSCLRRARDVIFWPGMTQDIRQYIEGCTVCATFSDRQAPEPLLVHEVCHRPWEKVGSDIFSINERNYLITVDYCSNFFEVDFLSDTLSDTVITKLKHHFARHGIPDTLISDGGPQYTSNAFQKFSQQWQFQHVITSPGNSKANGAAEAAVKVAKRLMRKCHAAHEDPYLGLLNLRNTPTEGLDISPAQRLFGRRTKTIMPTTFSNLRPSFENNKATELQDKKRAKWAERTGHHRRELRPLAVGEPVRLQPTAPHQREWRPATITRQLPYRTYEVVTPEGRTLRRNRQLIRPTQASHSLEAEVDPSDWRNSSMTPDVDENCDYSPDAQCQFKSPVVPLTHMQQPASAPAQTHESESYPTTVDYPRTRSGRISKPVVKLDL